MKEVGTEPVGRPEIPLRVPAHGNGELRVGNPGNVGGNGRPPNIIREFSRESYDEIAQKIAPACIGLAEGISALISDDPQTQERAIGILDRVKRSGFTVDQLLKAAQMFQNAGLPKQSEITLANPDVLNVVAECIGQIYGPGRVEECIGLITRTLDGT